MRIHNGSSENTLPEVSIYLTTYEAARLHTMLGNMLQDVRVQDFSVSDDGLESTLRFRLYSEQEAARKSSSLPDSPEGDR